MDMIQCIPLPTRLALPLPKYDDWYEIVFSMSGLLFALSDRFDRDDFLTCFLSKWQYWCDAYKFRD